MVYNQYSFRQWARWPGRTLAAALGGRAGQAGAGTWLEQRRAYDADLAGAAAPETEFVSVKQVRLMIGRFSCVEVYKENCDHLTVLGTPVIPRRVLLPVLGRLLGLDLYVHATK